MNESVAVVIGLLLMGAFIGFMIAPAIKTKEKQVKVPVSKEIKACEAKGGHYSLRWSEVYGRYVQECWTDAKEIEL